MSRPEFTKIGTEIGSLVTEKNAAYGDSFGRVADFLKILYPDGVRPDQYIDMLCLARIFDKQMRIANRKHAFNESPYADIAGYAILGVALDRGRGKVDNGSDVPVVDDQELPRSCRGDQLASGEPGAGGNPGGQPG